MAQNEAVDEAFVFLEQGSDPAVDRRIVEHTGARTLVVFVPDTSAAARIAAELADGGIRLIELYRGFDLSGAATVIDAVDGRAPVGVARYGFTELDDKRVASARNWAQIFLDEQLPPHGERFVHEHRDGSTTTVVGAPDASAPDVAAELARSGVDVIEICGGTPLTTAARVAAIISDAVVGHVTFPLESIDGVAAYKASYEAWLSEQSDPPGA